MKVFDNGEGGLCLATLKKQTLTQTESIILAVARSKKPMTYKQIYDAICLMEGATVPKMNRLCHICVTDPRFLRVNPGHKPVQVRLADPDEAALSQPWWCRRRPYNSRKTISLIQAKGH